MVNKDDELMTPITKWGAIYNKYIGVPCITEMTAFNALAEPKETKTLLSDESKFF